MKNVCLTLILLMVYTGALLAQVPQYINYQAVARNAQGSPIANSGVAVLLSIHDSTATGSVVYSERDTATTNQFGIFTCHIWSRQCG